MSLLGIPKKKWLKVNWDSASKTINIRIDRAYILQNEQFQAVVNYGDQAMPFQGSYAFDLNVVCRRAGGECIQGDIKATGSLIFE